MPDSFGGRAPASLVHLLLAICHRNHGPWYSRLLAPLLRRYVVRHAHLPLDLTLDGLCMRCVFRDNYSEKKFVFTPWRYDREERRLLQQHLGSDGVFLDIGANVGIYTLTALTAPGFEGQIYAFEPNPATRQRLQFNVQATLAGLPLPGQDETPAADEVAAGHDAGNSRVRLLPFGIADQHSQFVLQLDASNLGASSINTDNRSRQSHASDMQQQVVIDCKPLLDVLQEFNIQHISVLKIDIEGAEDKAMAPYLREAPSALLATLVIIENSEHLWQEDIFALLMQRGYQRILRNRMNSVFKLAASTTI